MRFLATRRFDARRLFPALLSVLLLALSAGLLAGCDDAPGNVEDFDIQPAVNVSVSDLAFTQGQDEPPTFTVTYQGLESTPTITSPDASFSFERIEETGSPESGSQTWAVYYEGVVPLDEALEETILVRVTTPEGSDVERRIAASVSSPEYLTLSSQNLAFTQGQPTLPTFTVTYQDLESVPTASADDADLTVEKIDETGSAQDGTQTWRVRFDGEVSNTGAFEGTVTVRGVTAIGSREVTEQIGVRVVNAISIDEGFTTTLATIADYEDGGRALTTSGGATAEIVTGEAAARASGPNVLRVDGPGTATVARSVSAMGAGVFSLLAKANSELTLTLTFADATGDGGTQDFEAELGLPDDGTWRRYSIVLAQVFGDDFDPVAERDGGDGALQSVSLSTDAGATFYVDELAFGTEGGPSIEVDDFERTSLVYSGGGITFEDTDAVAPGSDGVTARRITYSGGGNVFGYNYQVDGGGPALFLDAEEGVLRYTVGNVPRGFRLFTFLETVDEGSGRVGGFAYGSGVERAIAPGEDFRTVEIPLSELGEDLSGLRDGGLVNIGFEVRPASEDELANPIVFTLDDVQLRADD